eukprot:579316_1
MRSDKESLIEELSVMKIHSMRLLSACKDTAIVTNLKQEIGIKTLDSIDDADSNQDMEGYQSMIQFLSNQMTNSVDRPALRARGLIKNGKYPATNSNDDMNKKQGLITERGDTDNEDVAQMDREITDQMIADVCSVNDDDGSA